MQDILAWAQHHILPFIIVISIVVFIHEFGHYIIARACGVKIESFSIGFGGELFGWTDSHGTRWKISWLPLGGYVKMFGDADPASSPSAEVKTMSDDEKRVAFFHQSVDKRMAIVVAGPAFNYIFAILAFALLFATEGQPFSAPVVGSLVAGGIAEKAGLLAGDHITAIDGQEVERFEDIKRIVSLNEGSSINLTVTRSDATLTFPITPEVAETTDRFGGTHKMGRIGIVADKMSFRELSPSVAVIEAARETWTLTTSTLRALGQIIMGVRGTDELGGPLRIADMASRVAHEGTAAVIWFMGVISINLGLINLFPVPLLDGGHLMFYLFEKVRGRPLHERLVEYGMRVGMAMVLSLMVFATWNDLVQLKVISYLRGLLS